MRVGSSSHHAVTLSFVLFIAVTVGTVAFVATAAANGPADVQLDDLNGDGTETNPYEITDASELQAIEQDLGANYTLVNDIDASETDGWNAGDGFDPIGNLSDPFTGTFNGSGHTVSNLYINRSVDYIGLFGYVNSDGTIESVGLENVSIDGNNRVGGLVGSTFGEVNESYATGNVTGSSDVGGLIGENPNGNVNKSYATGNVTSDDGQRVGGLIGENNGGTVNESYATGNVTGPDFFVGGLVGRNSGKVSESYATGDVTGRTNVGGLVGRNRNSGEVNDSYATGNVTGESDVGGLLGRNDRGTVGESYATGNVTGNSNVGGLVGDDSGTVTTSYWDMNTTGQDTSAGGATGLTTAEMKGDAAKETGNMTDFDFATTWNVVDGFRDGAQKISYPYLVANKQEPEPGLETIEVLYAGGEGTEAEPLEIANWMHLDNVRKNLGANFTLVNDLNQSTDGYDNVVDSPTEGFDPIGDSIDRFTGTFNGSEHTISELSIDRENEDDVGLFGYVGSDGTVENFGLEDVSVKGNKQVGGLVGQNRGDVSESYATGSVKGSDDRVGGLVGNNTGGTVSKSYASGSVTGSGNWAGGLVGHNAGDIFGSYATSSVDGTKRNVGGLVGRHDDGEITDSYATGSVNSDDNRVGGLVGWARAGTTITDSYATGSVNGHKRVGGLVGYNVGTITDSYATGSVDGSEQVGGLVGENDGDVGDSYWDKGTTNKNEAIGADFGISSNLVGFGETSDTEPAAEMLGINATVEMHRLDFEDTWRPGNPSYPDLAWDSEFETSADILTGDGDATPYEITNAYELQAMTYNLSANYVLANDIDAEHTEEWFEDGGEPKGFEPVGKASSGTRFAGTFNGSGHTVSNLYINRSVDYIGLFGVVDSVATVENVGLEHVRIDGSTRVGGLAGDNRGTVRESYVTGSVNGSELVGGLVGMNLESVSESYATASVNGSANRIGGLVGVNNNFAEVNASYATGSVSGVNQVGGLVGRNTNSGKVSESYATGNVTGSDDIGGLVGNNLIGTISNTSASGTVNGSAHVGGLVGHNQDEITTSFATGYVNFTGIDIGGLVGFNSGGTAIDTYWDTESTNQSDSDGGTGLSTAQMSGVSAIESDNMGALDFSDMWTATDSYPLLQWSVASLDLTLADAELTEGETTDATVTVTTADDREVGATTTSDYSSSESNAASVDSTGKVSADSPGSTTITAELAALSDNMQFSVLAAPSSSGGSGGSGGSSSASGSRSETDTDPEAETEPEIDTDPEAETEPEIDTDPEAETEPESDTEPETNTELTDDSVPGFGVIVALTAFLVAASLAVRRD